MSETAPEATQDGNNSGATSATDKFEAITSQEALDKALGKRLERERAKFSDYDELKAKATQLDALSQASKSEQEKLTDRITSLENDLKESRLNAARADIAREFGLTEKQAAALQYAPSEKAAREIAEGLAADTSDRKKSGPLARREGQTITSPADSDAAFAKTLFGG